MKEKVILAYSGGLDTTVLIPWLKETYDYDIIAVCIDVGQGKETDGLEQKALKTGASKFYLLDVIEEFLQKYLSSWLSYGKLRASYGSTGNNSGVGRFEQLETLTVMNYMASDVVKGFVNKKMINKELSWEVSTIFNLGLDLGFLDNRLMTEIDFYNRMTTGMNRPSQMSIHLTGAYTAPRANIGDMQNTGVELNLTWRDKIGAVDYSVNLNGAYNRTTLKEWNEFLSRGWIYLDMPYHFLYAYEDEGIAQTWEDVYSHTPQGIAPGDVIRKDLNGDGIIDGKDRKAYR